ncbi:unnamed protein product [Chilo suppressalis]|uniref:Uncharacterized protein n=1 Tax=Chilo suppressalis TaxID=168631 RepID=A0ABN8L180_CHISP|nr:unnamed protein product [Chilo suppressalis]
MFVIADEMWSSVECGAKSGAAPCSRGKHSATLLGGYVYVLGGRGAGGAVPLRDFWRYCLATGVWERLECRGEPPPALQEHSATAHEQRLYVFGGEPGASSNETPLWIYDTQTRIWRKLPGQSKAGNYSATLRRRSTKEQRVSNTPKGRRGHSAHALKDCLLIYGGYKDLRGSTNELWAFHYETESWHQVRTANAGPARHRHAAALHDNRLYVHGGQCDLRDCADLWHYDTTTETWERIPPSMVWPSARVDAAALLVPAAPAGASALPAWPAAGADGADARSDTTGGGCGGGAGVGLVREISRLSGLHRRGVCGVRGVCGARGHYSALSGARDSTESLLPARHDAAIAKSRSAYAIDMGQMELPRDGVSVPDFQLQQATLPTPALTPGEAARLVWLHDQHRDHATILALPDSTVRYSTTARSETEPETEGELSTSDYASAERVNRLSGASLGFSNPHYGGPDVRALAALTPDSGLAHDMIEMKELKKPCNEAAPSPRLHVLLVGGREPAHPARLHTPLSMWAYRLL